VRWHAEAATYRWRATTAVYRVIDERIAEAWFFPDGFDEDALTAMFSPG
jgi:hypothetical protein